MKELEIEPVQLQQLLSKYGLNTTAMTPQKEILGRVYVKLSEWMVSDALDDEISIKFYQSMLLVRLEIADKLRQLG